MPDLDSLPTYAQLLERTDAPAGSAWGLFGKDDQLGRWGEAPGACPRAKRRAGGLGSLSWACRRMSPSFNNLSGRVDGKDSAAFSSQANKEPGCLP